MPRDTSLEFQVAPLLLCKRAHLVERQSRLHTNAYNRVTSYLLRRALRGPAAQLPVHSPDQRQSRPAVPLVATHDAFVHRFAYPSHRVWQLDAEQGLLRLLQPRSLAFSPVDEYSLASLSDFLVVAAPGRGATSQSFVHDTSVRVLCPCP